MFLCWSSTKIVQAIMIRQKTWPPEGGFIFPIYLYKKNFKNLLVRNHWTDFKRILQKCFFDNSLPTLFKPFGFVKNMASRGQGSFSLYIYIEKLKTLLVRNQWTDFNIIWQECVFGHPLSRFKPLWFVKKCGCKGAGLIFPLYLYRKLEKITSCQKPLDRFQYNLAEMFPWWPFTKIVQAVMICQKTWLLGAGAYFPCISI